MNANDDFNNTLLEAYREGIYENAPLEEALDSFAGEYDEGIDCLQEYVVLGGDVSFVHHCGKVYAFHNH